MKNNTLDISFLDHLRRLLNEMYKYEYPDQETRDKIKVTTEHIIKEIGDFNVRCNEENNPPTVVDNGSVIVTITKKENTGEYKIFDLIIGNPLPQDYEKM